MFNLLSIALRYPTQIPRILALAAVISLLAVGSATKAHAQCSTSGLCPSGYPCTISGTKDLGSGTCVLNFGSNAVTIGGGALVFIADGGTINITAGNFTLAGTLRARENGTVAITTSGNFASSGSGAIEVHAKTAGNSGFINVSAAGSVTLNGSGWNADGHLGDITIAGTTVSIANQVHASGSFTGDAGGLIDVTASAGNLEVLSDLTANGLGNVSTQADGGPINLTASAGQVYATGGLTANGSGDGGNGGAITISAGGAATLDTISSTATLGGSGGAVDITAGGLLAIRAAITVSGVSGDPYGGSVWMTAPSVQVNAAITANATNNGSGGTIDILATSPGGILTSSTGNLSANGGASASSSYGGSVALYSDGDITLNGNLNATASGSNGQGGIILVYADGALVQGSGSSVSTETPTSGVDGSVTFCGSTVNLAGSIDNRTTTPDHGGQTNITYLKSFVGLPGHTMLADDQQGAFTDFGNHLICKCAATGGTCNTPAVCEGTQITKGTYTPALGATTPSHITSCVP